MSHGPARSFRLFARLVFSHGADVEAALHLFDAFKLMGLARTALESLSKAFEEIEANGSNISGEFKQIAKKITEVSGSLCPKLVIRSRGTVAVQPAFLQQQVHHCRSLPLMRFVGLLGFESSIWLLARDNDVPQGHDQ